MAKWQFPDAPNAYLLAFLTEIVSVGVVNIDSSYVSDSVRKRICLVDNKGMSHLQHSVKTGLIAPIQISLRISSPPGTPSMCSSHGEISRMLFT